MAYTALFFNFSKRRNSTKVPVDSTGTSFDVVLKSPTSFEAPTLRINASSFNYNYAKFNGDYYFIDDVIAVRNDLYEISLIKDVLATYRTEILATNAFVIYDTVGNNKIIDDRLNVVTDTVYDMNAITLTAVSQAGKYVITVVGRHGTNAWVIPSTTDLTNLVTASVEDILGPVSPMAPTFTQQLWQSFKELRDCFTQLLASGSASENIRSCFWLPWNISGDVTPQYNIFLGSYDTGVSGSIIQNPIITYNYSVGIPWPTNDWRRLEPYTRVYIYIPFIGVVHVPSSSISNYDTLEVQYALNKLTGNISVLLWAGGEEKIGSYGGNTSVNVPIGVSNVSPSQHFNTLAAAAGTVAMASAGAMTGAAAIAAMTATARGALVGHGSALGGLSGGGEAGLPLSLQCYTVFHNTNITPSSVAPVIGLPSFSNKTIGSLSGFVQTREFSLAAVAHAQDLEAVNNYMNGGVFIE